MHIIRWSCTLSVGLSRADCFAVLIEPDVLWSQWRLGSISCPCSRSAGVLFQQVTAFAPQTGWQSSAGAYCSGLSASVRGKALERKPADLVLGLASGRQVGEDFADDRGKLEPVARAWRSNNDVRITRKTVENEIAIRRDGVKAGRGLDPAPVGVGEMIRER